MATTTKNLNVSISFAEVLADNTKKTLMPTIWPAAIAVPCAVLAPKETILLSAAITQTLDMAQIVTCKLFGIYLNGLCTVHMVIHGGSSIAIPITQATGGHISLGGVDVDSVTITNDAGADLNMALIVAGDLS